MKPVGIANVRAVGILPIGTTVVNRRASDAFLRDSQVGAPFEQADIATYRVSGYTTDASGEKTGYVVEGQFGPIIASFDEVVRPVEIYEARVMKAKEALAKAKADLESVKTNPDVAKANGILGMSFAPWVNEVKA